MPYQVTKIAENIPDFKMKFTELLFLENSPYVLGAMEEFLVKIITHEHMYEFHRSLFHVKPWYTDMYGMHNDMFITIC